MDPSEKFLRFAAECELMAKFTRSPENKTVWTRMAERWAALVPNCMIARRCTPAVRRGGIARPVHSSAH